MFCIAAASLFAELTLEEKVGQLFMVHFHGNVANEEAKALIQELHVGGIIYYNWANDLNSPDKVKNLSRSLQEIARIPLFIAIDQEGGKISRFSQWITSSLSAERLGEINNPDLTEETAFLVGEQLQKAGVNMNLAPVVDVNSNPRNPIIGPRAYSHSPEMVYIHGERALRGYERSGIIATLKHFPGHGDTAVDSHLDLPILSKSLEELEKVELLPFARLSKKAGAIMMGHILTPSLDEEYCATLSSKTVAYLRETLGFQGLILSDSLVMQGVLNQCESIDEAAIRAIQAGLDMIILGGKAQLELTLSDVRRIHGSILKAVQSGRIPEKRLSEAVEKILSLKNTFP